MPTISAPTAHSPSAGVFDEHDGDYEYFWTRGELEIPIPRWLAEIVDVPLGVRLEIFAGGICAGLLLAAVALTIGFYLAMG